MTKEASASGGIFGTFNNTVQTLFQFGFENNIYLFSTKEVKRLVKRLPNDTQEGTSY